ncbi:o-succinylbenzoate--CoA ligase [candidate division KSB1 bacterium]|nr:o-succinylbenzoate--CoA ligase [candidate division KSB1 bacterium]
MARPFSHLTLHSIIDDHPDAPAIISAAEQISWRQVAAGIADKRLGLLKLGLQEGDKCAIYAPASVASVETLLAMWSMGIVAVPLNTRLPVGQIGNLLNYIECDYLITESPIAVSAWLRCHSLSDVENQTAKKSIEGYFKLNSDATIIFTSGSTGTGKACLHTVGNHFYSALGSNQNIRIEPGDAWLLSLPLYHVSGIAILFRCLLSGGAIVIPPAVSLADALRRLTPTHLSLVATQLQMLLAEHVIVEKLKMMKAILLGGSAMPAKLIERAFELGLPIHTSYGSTEMSSQITTTTPGASLQELKTGGAILQYRELMLTPDGEILVRGETLCRGYVHGAIVQSIADGDGWHHTRDLGSLDASGHVTIAGRADNMFISGGENIYPEEIERALERLAGIARALVVPIDDDKFGQRPVAFVEPQAGHAFDAIRFDELRMVLPGFKIPLRFFPWHAEKDAKPNRARLQHLAGELSRQSQS